MSVFLILMIAGLFGMVLMALPGMAHHGHAGIAGHGATTLPAHCHVPAAGTHAPIVSGVRAGLPRSAVSGAARGSQPLSASLLRLTQPRVIFALMALYGAFGYALVDTHLLAPRIAAFVAALPALLVERYAITPLWNMLLGFQGKPSTPLENLVMDEAVAVTAFHNGKGIVQVVRDGRAVQMSARLEGQQTTMPIHVGDRLRIENVDAANERVTVSLH